MRGGRLFTLKRKKKLNTENTEGSAQKIAKVAIVRLE